MDFRSILRNITKGDVTGHEFHGNQYTDGQAGFHLEGKDYEGKTGRSDHITRTENGTIPTDAIKFMLGASGEKPFDHRHRQGEDWEAFKADIAKNGIKEPIFITVDHNGTPVISEGNHRRDAAVELGMKEVPVEVRYFGNAQEQGTIAQRPFPTSDLSQQNPLHNGKPVQKGDLLGHVFHGNQWLTTGGGFNPNPKGRKPAVTDKPEVARKPAAVKDTDPPMMKPLEEGKKFIGVDEKNGIARVDKVLSLGGNQQLKMEKVTLENGETAVVKQIGNWKYFSGEEMAENEVLASKIGEACNFPIRGCQPVEGKPDTIIQPWIEGQSIKNLAGEFYPVSRTGIQGAPNSFQNDLKEIAFFDYLTGNPDRHSGNVMIAGIPDTVQTVSDAAQIDGASCIGIDHSLCFNKALDTSDLRDAGSGLLPGRIEEIRAGLDTIKANGANNNFSTAQRVAFDNTYRVFNLAFSKPQS